MLDSISPIAGPVLETERLILRPPTGSDYPGFRSLIMSERGRFIGGPLDDAGRAWRAFASIIGHWHMRGFGTFTILDRDSEEPLGVCGHWFPEGWPEIELGWSLYAGQEGNGIASEAALAVRDYSFMEMQLETLVSYINPQNLASVRVAERIGAVRDETAEAPGDDVVIFRHSMPAGS